MKTAKGFLLFVMLLAMSIAMFAQEDITSEDDITRMLYEDDISYEDYILLLELYREKVDINGNDLSDLAQLPWINDMDVQEILRLRKDNGNYFSSLDQFEQLYGDDYARIASFLTILPPNLKLYNGKFRLYNRNRLSESGYDPYTTSKLSFRADNFGFDISTREEDFEPLFVSSRSAYLDYGKHHLELGTFQEALGTGMIFGRHLYITKSLRVTDPVESFITPADGYNNGLYWEMTGKYKPKVALTVNDYDDVKVAGYAGQFGYMLNGETEIGGVVAMGSAEVKSADDKYEQSAFSAYALGKFGEWRYEVEAGYAEDPGLAGRLQYSKEGLSLKLSLWTYGKEFRSLYSNGIADKNKATSYLTPNISYSSAQQAETGGKFDVRIPLGDMFKLRLWNSYWQNQEIDEHGSYISTTLYADDFWGDSRANLGYTYESNPQGGEDNTKETIALSVTKSIDDTELKYYFNLRNYTTVEQLLYSEYDGLDDDYAYLAETSDDKSVRLSTYLSQKFPVNEWIELQLREKIYDPDIHKGADGYFEFSLAEDVDIDDVTIKLEGRWKKYFEAEEDEIFELRLNLATAFGFERVIREVE